MFLSRYGSSSLPLAIHLLHSAKGRTFSVISRIQTVEILIFIVMLLKLSEKGNFFPVLKRKCLLKETQFNKLC